MHGKGIHMTAFFLAIIGALNYGLVGLGGLIGTNLDVLNLILGSWPTVELIVYLLIGLSALHLVISHKKDCKKCSTGGA